MDPYQFHISALGDIITEFPSSDPVVLTSIMSVRYQNKEPSISPGFVYSSRGPILLSISIPNADPIGSTIYNPTKDPTQVPIINPPSSTSETTTKYPSHGPK